MNNQDEMDRIYRDKPLDDIPWVRHEPPAMLVDLVESGVVQPCCSADLGCGAGSDAVWLAGRGFDITGFDCSGEAIQHAERLATEKSVSCRFEVADLTRPLEVSDPKFDFVYHWALLHHLFPEYRTTFAGNTEQMLKQGGKQLCMCFSEEDEGFGGTGKYRVTPLGTTLYFSSEKEIRELFEPGFRILDLHTAEVPGMHRPHQAVVAWMEKG